MSKKGVGVLSQIAKVLWRVALVAFRLLREAAVVFWSVARGPVIAVLNILAALWVLFEEWGWRPLSEFLARLARYAPIAAVERWVAGLPPYGALVALAVPTSVLFPLKLVAVWLLANRFFFTASLLFVFAKIASTALIARVFVLTKPALMRLSWFASAYTVFESWKDSLFEQIRSSAAWRYGRAFKVMLKRQSSKFWTWARPRFEKAWLDLTGEKLPWRRTETPQRMLPESVPRPHPPINAAEP